jgi:hypothetical protein
MEVGGFAIQYQRYSFHGFDLCLPLQRHGLKKFIQWRTAIVSVEGSGKLNLQKFSQYNSHLQRIN